MALREFTDPHGRHWTVWSVRPTSDIRLRSTRQQDEADEGPDMLRDGWLVFEASGERRRLVPIPAGWEEIGLAELQELCTQAVAVPARRRHLD